MKLLVTGGNGFIGREVCRLAVEAGHEVVGLGRRGRPAGSAAWMSRVTWAAADVLEPAAWRAHLAGCGAVVHCVGIVFERPERGVTFERMNGDAAVVAAREAEAAGVDAFVFLSASEKPPFLRDAYITAKRRAEEAVLGRDLRGVVLRPGLVYGPGRAPSVPVAMLMRLGMHVPGVRGLVLPNRPLPVETVARAAVRAAAASSFGGVLDVDAIEQLGAA